MYILLALAAQAADPTLLEEVAPIWPAGALERGEVATVDLLLSLDETGAVTAATVLASGGEAFDRAAIQAARNLRFTPATDERGRPVPVSLQWRTVFEPTRVPVPSLEGTVRAAGTREPVGGFDVVLQSGDVRRVAITGPDGRFVAADLPPGAWTVRADEPGWSTVEVGVTTEAGKVVEVTLRPTLERPWEAGADEVTETVEIVGRAVVAEVTERTLSQEEARYLPGTNGDVVKVVQNLPGVARPPLGIGQLIIRGTAPEDSAYYLDGVPIPLVFHFGGFSTVLNGDAIDEIAFLPGNYGVRYGRTLGGVVDLKTGQQLPDRSSGYVSVDTFQTTLFAEQRLKGTAFTVSGRRSYADTFLNPILNAASDATIRVPRYYDLQVRVLGSTPRGGSLDTLFLLSDDQFRVLGEDADEQETVQIGLSTTFSRLRLAWTEPLGGEWRHELAVGVGPERQSFDFQDGVAYEEPFGMTLRDEVLRPAPTSGVGLGGRVGTDTLLGRYRFEYAIPGFGDPEGAEVLRFLPAAYGELAARLGPAVLVPGVRVDGAVVGPDHAAVAVDPRLSARLEVGQSTVLKASAGGYSQFPTVRQVVQVPTLGPQRSWQVSAGLEQRLAEPLRLELAAFGNRLTDLVSGREDAFRFFSGPPPTGPLDTGPFANDGVGTIYGVETFLRWQSERTAAWGSATFSRSTRTDRPGDEAELFDYDQPVVLTALVSHELPKRWRLGGRVRYSSGNPYTPVVNRFEDLDSRTFVPVFGATDSARLPAFWSIDARVDHDWVYRNWTLTAYLDLQNATNRQNVEVMGWTFDYAEEDPVAGIPLLPAFGFRGEW
jgi:TonB family protein